MFRNYTLLAGCLTILLFSGISGSTVSDEAAPSTAESDTLAPAAGKFLVAARDLGDWHFSQTVVYLLRHNRQGTLGLIINRPGKIPLPAVVEGLDSEAAFAHRLRYGGPVESTLVTMLIHDAQESPMIEYVADDIYFSIYREVMQQLLDENKPADKLHFYRGHAGWLPGQLDNEIRHGDWHLIDGDARTIFDSENSTLWQRLIRKLEPEGLLVDSDRENPPGRPRAESL
jgi:putative transcriptional regulator